MMTPLHENVLRKRSDGTLAAEDIDGANEADYQQYLVQRQQHQQQQGGVLLENDESAYIVDMMSDADDIPLRQRHLPSLLAAGLPIERSDTNWSSTSGLGIEYWSTNNPTASMHAATAAGASGVGGGSPTMTAPSSPYISGYTNNNNVAPLSVAANLNPALQSPQQQPQYQPSPLSHVRHVATTSSSSPTPLHHYPFTASPGRMSPASSSSSSSAAAVAANEGDCDAVKMELEEEKQQLPPHLPPNGTLHKQSESNSSPSSVSIYRDSGGTAGVERKCADCAERDEEDEAIICSHITSDSSCIIATTTSSPINVPGKDRRGVGVVGSGSAANVDVTACDTDDNDASVLGNLSPFSLKIPIMKRMGGSIAKLKRPTLLKALTMPNNHPVGGGGGSGSKLSASSIVRLGGSPGYLSPAIASANNASPSSDAMSASYPPPDHSITNSSSNTPYYKIQKIGSNNINNNNNEVVNASTYRSMDNYLGSNNKLTRASPYSANPASTNMTSCPDLRSSPSSDPSSALALARLGTTASSTLAGSSSNIINGAGSSTTARYPIPIHRNNNNKRRSKTDYDEDDIISSGFTLPANSQMLTVSRRGDITGGTSLHPSGIDVFEMEREMDLGLQGRWPERVVLRVRKWWLTSQQVSVNDGTGGGGGTSAGKNMLERLFDPQSGGSGGGSGNAASAVALLSHPRPSMDSDHAIPHHQDVLVMELDLRNEDEFRRFVGTVATF